ncbi:beta-propeller domain-containing protein [Candidatus Micrarchaeota archaeon]|nr:beta-propeller domain-containing protein [Candidatus Micrarchaeota archaeon]
MKENANSALKIVASFVFVFAIVGVLYVVYFNSNGQPSTDVPVGVKTFGSCSAMSSFIKTNAQKSYPSYWGSGVVRAFTGVTGAISASPSMAEGGKATDYSTTNIQVAGVDEADITKNDGKYIYTLSGDKVVIIDAYPAESAAVLSEIAFNSSTERVTEMFVNGDKLVLFGDKTDYNGPIMGAEISYRPYYYRTSSFVKIYDIVDRSNPILTRDVAIDGNYYSSRMIGDYVYVVLNSYVYEDIVMPNITAGGVETPVAGCADVQYFEDVVDSSYSLTTIMSINVNTEEMSEKVFLTGNTQTMYVSTDNIYLTSTQYYYEPMPLVGDFFPRSEEKTLIKRVGINGNTVEFKAEGSVPGWILNQFSMDEYNGNFRIATTSGHVSRSGGGSSNNVYVLNGSLDTIGTLEDLAPGEQIYSARFLGDRAYLVTFKKIDPLFAIDLSDPTNPNVLGKLKIPGYSSYLHPYDETHLIGIGKNAIEAEEGDFAWYQGVKLSLFDVSDVANPKEMSMVSIGERGTDSYALNDHKAFLFDKEKGLLVVPILLAEFDAEPQSDWDYGEYTFQGAYVYSVDLTSGFTYKGRITHVTDDSLLKSGYYYESPYSVKRSLYMDNTLYTISEKTVKANSLIDLSELANVSLPYEGSDYYYGYYGV